MRRRTSGQGRDVVEVCRGAARALAVHRDGAGVAAEGPDVVVGPPQSHGLVLEARVAWRVGGAHGEETCGRAGGERAPGDRGVGKPAQQSCVAGLPTSQALAPQW